MKKNTEYTLTLDEYKAEKKANLGESVSLLSHLFGYAAFGAGVAIIIVDSQLPSISIIGGTEFVLGGLLLVFLGTIIGFQVERKDKNDTNYISCKRKRLSERERIMEAKLD